MSCSVFAQRLTLRLRTNKMQLKGLATVTISVPRAFVSRRSSSQPYDNVRRFSGME